MNDRKLTILAALTAVLTAGEFGSAIEIGLGKDPWGAGFAIIFGVLFGLATWLLRRGRVRAGAVFTGLLCLFELLEYPSWHKHGAVQWATDTAAVAGAAVAVALAGSVAAAAFDPAGSAVFAETLSFGIAVSAVAVVGAVITLAVPGNRVGWLLLASAATMGIGSGCTEAGIYGVVTDPGSVPGAAYLAALGPGLQAAGMLAAVVGVPAVFPGGRLPGPRWHWLGWAVGAAVGCLFLGNVLSPHAQQSRLARWRSPLGLTDGYAGVASALSSAGVLLAAAAAAGAVTGLVLRWRRGGPLVRQQLLFLALAACRRLCSSSPFCLPTGFPAGSSAWS